MSISRFFVFLFLVSSLSFSQTKEEWGQFYMKVAKQKSLEPSNYFLFTENFVTVFNSNEIENLIPMSSESLMSGERKKKNLGFLQFYRDTFGKITSLHYKYFDTRHQREPLSPLAVYTMKFEDGSLWELRIGLDEEYKLDRFIITDNNYNESHPLVDSRLMLKLPFSPNDKWQVLWGGLTHEDNYHVKSESQKNAADFLIRNKESGLTYINNGQTNTDYYAFGKPIHSPISGLVVKVIEGVEDNIPGETNSMQLTGNTVIIKAEDEFALLAHFKKGSISVTEGETINQGEFIGLCGNSGNSTEPHLHMQVMTDPNMKEARGLKMFFQDVKTENGLHIKYSPEKGDFVNR